MHAPLPELPEQNVLRQPGWCMAAALVCWAPALAPHLLGVLWEGSFRKHLGGAIPSFPRVPAEVLLFL